MRPVRIGVVGCGFYAQNHLHAWSSLESEGAKLAAVCDIDTEKAQAASSNFSVPWFAETGEMIRLASIDLLDVVTRMDSHRELAEIAAKQNIGAIVQKPFARDIAECRKIVECAEQHNTWLAVHENFRFTDGMRRIKAILNEGSIGIPTWARISFRTGFDVYKSQPYLACEERFSILDCGVHLLDLARFLLGEVERISCESQTRNPNVRGEDTATMLLRHTSGAVSVVETTYESRRIPDSFPETLLEIETSNGAILTHPDDCMTISANGKATNEQFDSPLLSWTSQPWHNSQLGVLRTNAHLLQSFVDNVPAETSGWDNLKTFALVEAAYLSAAENRSVNPADI